MSRFVQVSVPIEYRKLISALIDWLGIEKPTSNTFQYKILNNLLYSRPSETNFLPDILRPYAHINGFFLTRAFLQKEIVDPFEFIYSPTSLHDFLLSLNCLSASGNPVPHRSVYSWKLNYRNRAEQISQFKIRGARGVAEKKELLHFDSINFLNRGGDKKLKVLLARHYEISHHVVSDDDFLNIYSSERFQ
jgi:hypothetical protein